jgi:hypothetical protein
VDKTVKRNFSLPVEVSDAFDVLCERVGGKDKWIVVSASIAAFANLSGDEQNDFMARVVGAAKTGVFNGIFPAPDTLGKITPATQPLSKMDRLKLQTGMKTGDEIQKHEAEAADSREDDAKRRRKGK